VAGGGTSRAGKAAKIALHAFGRTQAARPLEPVLGGFERTKRKSRQANPIDYSF
jgi:hypothetical protein